MDLKQQEFMLVEKVKVQGYDKQNMKVYCYFLYLTPI